MLDARFRFTKVLLSLLALTVGCSSDPSQPPGHGGGGSGATGGGGTGGTGGTGGSPYDGPCKVLALGDTSVFLASIARVGVQAPVQPPIQSLAKTRLTMELYEDDGSGALPPLATGTFAFNTPPDDNYGTCQHCVLLVGYDLSEAPKRAFYPKNGTLRIDQLPDDLSLSVVGRAEKMELVEVTQKPDFTWEVLPGGACYYVDAWDFDTRPVDGAPCTSAEQCPNELDQVCSPRTGTCAPKECSLTFDPPFCGTGEVCLSQLVDFDQPVSGAATGACYTECDPSNAGSCGADSICRPLGPTQSFGVCLKAGKAAVGEACTPRDISTECAPGAACTGEVGECARICSFLTDQSGCDAGRYCAVSNLCERPETGDAAAIGGTCASSSPELVECGIEGDAFRGLCMKFFLEDPTLSCERLCRTESPACPGGQVCLGVFSNPVVGICRTPAVCGDGALDVVGGEVCDDGNTVSGDGCSADCLAPELDVLCGKAKALTLGADIAGTTVGGPTGYASQCDPYNATPVATYAFQPPSAGRLRISLKSAADLGLSVLDDCADSGTERACQNSFGDDILDIQLAAAPAKPLLVVVRGAAPSHAGPFTLRADFTPMVCGDGQAVGTEVCDDGNTQSGDGCSGDCQTIEWATVCAALPQLSTSTTNDGTTVGAQDLWDLAGQCSFVNGAGPERAYSFTAPSNGTLKLTLTQPSADFSLYVQDGCGPASSATQVACSNSAFIGSKETAAPTLTAGQKVTVIVDGFRSTDAGPYGLSAEFVPN